MPNWIIGAVALGIFIFILILEYAFGSKHPFKGAFFIIASGVLSLIAVNCLSVYTNVSVPISPLSLIISSAGGIPGVTAMVLINII